MHWNAYKLSLVFAVAAASILVLPVYSAKNDHLSPTQAKQLARHFRSGTDNQKNCNYDQALADFNKVIELLPERPAGYFGRGYTHMARNEPLDALRDFDTVLKVDPKARQAHFNKASCLVQADRPTEAIAEYTKCLKLNPRLMLAIMHRGRVYVLLNQPDEAIKDFTRALSINPNNHLLYLFRGRAYQMKGDRKRAQEDLQLANLNEEGFASSHFASSVEKLLKENPKSNLGSSKGKNQSSNLEVDNRIEKALKLKDRKDLKGALAELNLILAEQKNAITAYIVRGDVYLEMGKPDQAIGSFSQAWSRENMNLDAIGGRARAYLAKGDPNRAMADINKLIWFDPFCPDYYFEKAQTLVLLKRKKEALEAYQRFLVLAKQNADKMTIPITRYSINLGNIAIAKRRVKELAQGLN